ncbi:MAG: YqhA family protein [Alphaproteobacteria bacterium]|nr:YqhA family protein [Alphaproteobacteria bacterium]
MKRLESRIAGLLTASRWLMAPLYLGLIAALVVVGVAFFEELARTVVGVPTLNVEGVILSVLKLIDLVLIANLVLIMISAGIGSLGSVAQGVEHAEWSEFMGKVDFSGLKLKVVVSLVAIAAVDLLEDFVEIDTTNKTDLMWRIGILVAFVVTGVLLAWMDRLAEDHE